MQRFSYQSSTGTCDAYITMYIILLDFQKPVPQKKVSTLNRKKKCVKRSQLSTQKNIDKQDLST